MIKMTTKTSRRSALKEDIEHVLEELWNAEEKDTLYKIFKREFVGSRRIQKILRLSNAHLKDLSCRDDDVSVLCLQRHEVGDARIMVHYQSYLRAKELLPEDMDTFRFKSMARKIVSFS